jgi:tetratricopeptide (TPR) repeat protein
MLRPQVSAWGETLAAERGAARMNDHANTSAQPLGHAYFLDLLGDAYNGLGRHDEAIAVLSEAAGAFGQHDAQCARAECLFKIAQSHLAMGRGEVAIGFLEECLPVFRALGLPGHEEQAIRALDACRAAAAG